MKRIFMDQCKRSFFVFLFSFFCYVASTNLFSTCLQLLNLPCWLAVCVNLWYGALVDCCNVVNFCSMWLESCQQTQHKNSIIIVHSFAFGGRGFYAISRQTRTGRPLHANFKVNGRPLSAKSGNVFSMRKKFDATLGFPGEGPTKRWNKMESELKMTLWNPRSLTFERFKYSESLNFDVLVLPELWRNAHKFVNGTLKWTHGVVTKNKKGK